MYEKSRKRALQVRAIAISSAGDKRADRPTSVISRLPISSMNSRIRKSAICLWLNTRLRYSFRYTAKMIRKQR